MRGEQENGRFRREEEVVEQKLTRNEVRKRGWADLKRMRGLEDNIRRRVDDGSMRECEDGRTRIEGEKKRIG